MALSNCKTTLRYSRLSRPLSIIYHARSIASLSSSSENQRYWNERALVFPGQGSQYIGMGKDLYDSFPESRHAFEEADESLGFKLSTLMFDGDPNMLNQTEFAQPAIVTTSIAAVRALEAETGYKISNICRYTMGHSVGEYSALIAADALTLSDGVKLVKLRGKTMQEAAKGYESAMTAIILKNATLEQIGHEVLNVQKEIDEELGQDAPEERKEIVQIGNINMTTQVVLSGTRKAVDRAVKHLQSKLLAIRAININVSAPFHCDIMKPASKILKEEFDRVKPFFPPTIPVLSNATAEPIGCHLDIGSTLAMQAMSPARWLDSMNYLRDHGIKRWFCIGPGSVIANMVRREYPGMIVRSLATPKDITDVNGLFERQNDESS
ncbi:[acyl-carrier-protein] S-malonyltransferase [Mycoemilia scoparia]|uniref:[acyl-carrier-protein] S-malonyltransferase n=1 Tax=Mycoemilia scoparia TaxID=417184 RepID=A0A9W8A068_9FUNG|nr:[acyl-carrier-protein] S-malonyltransferase [Mycoemilia scoparia]